LSMQSAAEDETKRLREQIKDVAAALRRQRDARAKAQKRILAAGTQTHLRAATLAVYCLSQATLEAAAHFWSLERQRRPCQGEDCSLSRGLSIVTAWVEHASQDDFREARNPTTREKSRAHERALAYLANAGAAAWSADICRKSGHAPSTAEVWDMKTCMLTQSTPTPLHVPAAPATKQVRQWGWSWRRRWFFKSGRLKVREHFSVEDARKKARRSTFLLHGMLFCICTWSQKGDWNPAPPPRKNTSPAASQHHTWGRKAGPKRGPRNNVFFQTPPPFALRPRRRPFCGSGSSTYEPLVRLAARCC
jgi:hypothetical protein